MPKTTALDRARLDLADGRPDLARDRIQGYLHTLHLRAEYSQEAYLLLGDILFAMKDFARAGAAWLLTERNDENAQFAFQAFEQRFGKTKDKGMRIVKPHAPSELYPPAVQERLREWNYRYLPYRARTVPNVSPEERAQEAQSGLRPIEAGCVIVLIAAVIMSGFYLYSALTRH